MNNRSFERILKEREIRQRQYQFQWAMALTADEFACFIDQRHHPSFRHMGKEEFAWHYAVERARIVRGEEVKAIARGHRRLTLVGELIRVPDATEIALVDRMIRELGL
jgi:hypothetical protein